MRIDLFTYLFVFSLSKTKIVSKLSFNNLNVVCFIFSVEVNVSITIIKVDGEFIPNIDNNGSIKLFSLV